MPWTCRTRARVRPPRPAPTMTITTRRLDRRVMPLGLMALPAVANLAGAFAPNCPVMPAARVLTGVSIGGFRAFAAGLGLRLVLVVAGAPAALRRKTGIKVFGGLTRPVFLLRGRRRARS